MNDKKQNLIFSCATPSEMEQDLKTLMDFQDEGIPLEALEKIINENLEPHFVQYDRPEFNSLYNSFPEEGAKFGAAVALKYNQGVTNWQVSPGAVMVEELCGKAMCRLFGFNSNSDATFMYCGTYANQQALYLALHRKAEQLGFNFAEEGLSGFPDPSGLVVLASQDAHFSLKHAVRFLGLGDQSLVPVPIDQNLKMDVKALNEIVNDLKTTKEIICIVSTAGTTSTGIIDPILPIVEICKKVSAWSHIDGAYGLAFKLLREKEHLFSGIELADSVCWDPHKQFGVPIPNSLLFLRNKEDFNRLAIFGHYFNREDDPEPNPGLKSPPSTRPFSALPLVTTIRFQGLKKVVERLRKPIKAIEDLANKLKNEKDIEICNKPETGLLCIRLIPVNFPEERLDRLQQFIFEKIKNEGKRSISITKVNNKTALRLVAISPNVTTESLLETIEEIRKIAAEALRKQSIK